MAEASAVVAAFVAAAFVATEASVAVVVFAAAAVAWAAVAWACAVAEGRVCFAGSVEHADEVVYAREDVVAGWGEEAWGVVPCRA